MHVCVLGAGIVGLASAYSLRRAGHEVTVVDRANPGSGASGGNGAQLSYSYVQPLANPDIWRQLPKLLLSRTSPLKLHPRLDLQQWLWGVRFLTACNGSRSRQSTIQLLALATSSRQAFDSMMGEENLDCDFSATGKLVLYADKGSFANACRQLHLQRQWGSIQEAVNADRCVEIEPALKTHHREIAGAISTPGECAADCQKTCDALMVVLRRQGVKFLLDTPVEHLELRHNSVVAAATPQGPVEADQYVMALGTDSVRMARTLDVSLPIYPLKGYSITVETHEQHGVAPSVSVTDSARKVVFARIGSRLRVAGMVELSGYNKSVCPVQIASLKASAQALFPQCSSFGELNPWAGMRPATPTGLPVIGKHAKGPNNLLFNTGHGALGFTLAFGSAQRITDLLNGSKPLQVVGPPCIRGKN